LLAEGGGGLARARKPHDPHGHGFSIDGNLLGAGMKDQTT